MDDLDRMYRRLVQNIRGNFPDYLARPFEVSEIYQTIIPYRHNRRELEMETNQQYELALLQLLSGARGYITGDARMQEALKQELASPSPDLSAYRAFATTQVLLAPEGVRALDQQPASRRTPDGEVAPATARPAAGQPVAEQAAMAARPTVPLIESAPAGRSGAGASASGGAQSGAQSGEPSGASAPSSAATGAGMAGASAAASRSPAASGAATQAAHAAHATPAGGTAAATGVCPHCGGGLPEGRKTIYCPHCGQNLTIKHCPACGTELDANWRFCITCGRAMT